MCATDAGRNRIMGDKRITTKITYVVLLLMANLVICASDTRLKVTWDKYPIEQNPDVVRLALWEVNADTAWVRTVEDYISPLDTVYTFTIPAAAAYGIKYFVMVAVDSSGNRSNKSNVAKVKFNPTGVSNLHITIY